MTRLGALAVRRPAAAAAIVVAAHAVLLLVNSRLQFPTRNEVAHVPAGLSHWSTGTFELYSVNPPLWRMVATLPTLFLGPDLNAVELPRRPGERPEFRVAGRFAAANSDRYFDIVWSARLAGIIWSTLGGVIVYRWAAELYGEPAGLLATTLWCFDPNVLAHACLVTPDVPGAVAGLTATYAFRRYLRTESVPATAAAGFLLGVAQLTKFTLLVLYPTWALLVVAHTLTSPDRGYRPLLRHAFRFGLVVVTSVCVINMGYGLDRTLVPLGRYEFVSRMLGGATPSSGQAGNISRGTLLESAPVPLPHDYLCGIDLQRRDFEGRMRSYLRGEWSGEGWWYYYLYAAAVKTPVATTLLLLWGLVLTVRRSRLSAPWADELVLWLPAAAVLALVSSQTGFTNHLRYALPGLPFVYVATGKLAGYVSHGRRGTAVLVVALAVWGAGSSLAVYPYSLSYFNELVGGPSRGHEHLADSNIDWGQDLLAFKAWAERNPQARPIGLAYYHFIDYRVAGVDFECVPRDPAPGEVFAHGVSPADVGPRPGWFAVDIHNLTDPRGRCRSYRRFEPVARAGYSIFIYHVTPDQAEAARREMGLSPLTDRAREDVR